MVNFQMSSKISVDHFRFRETAMVSAKGAMASLICVRRAADRRKARLAKPKTLLNISLRDSRSPSSTWLTSKNVTSEESKAQRYFKDIVANSASQAGSKKSASDIVQSKRYEFPLTVMRASDQMHVKYSAPLMMSMFKRSWVSVRMRNRKDAFRQILFGEMQDMKS